MLGLRLEFIIRDRGSVSVLVMVRFWFSVRIKDSVRFRVMVRG